MRIELFIAFLEYELFFFFFKSGSARQARLSLRAGLPGFPLDTSIFVACYLLHIVV